MKRVSKLYSLFVVLWGMLCLVGCGGVVVPKPEGYPRFDFPPQTYRMLDTVLPYTCEIPTYAEMILRGDGKGHDLDFPQYKGTLYLTYFHCAGVAHLDSLYEDARRLAYKHAVRAESIEERVWEDMENRVYAVMYHVSGPVATCLQFYATDSVEHFLRGALYFYSQPNPDSLAPAIERYGADVEHFVETIRWR